MKGQQNLKGGHEDFIIISETWKFKLHQIILKSFILTKKKKGYLALSSMNHFYPQLQRHKSQCIFNGEES